MSECGFQEVPAGVDDLPAGAALAAVLESSDPRRVTAHDTMRLLAAHRRQLAHQQAAFSAALLHAALADPAVPGHRTDAVGRFGGDELRLVLHESATAIQTMLRRAEFADARPVVSEAWDAGRIERERVRILDTWTEALSEEHRAAVLEIAVPEAGGLTQKGLIDRVEQLARDLDPDWAAKRYEAHKRQRRVRARRTEAGTVNLSGLDLGLDDGALAERHIAVMAKRAKALGHPGLTDTIEADIYVALLKPRPADWSDDDVIAAVIAAASPADPPDPRSAPDPDQAPAEPRLRPDGTDPTTADHPDVAAPGCADPDCPDPDCPDPEDPAPECAAAGDTGCEELDLEKAGAAAGLPATPLRGVRWPQRAKLALRVGLGTLLGLDRYTATMPGYGVVHAEQARQLTRDWADAEWRLALQDDTGALSTVLVTLKRPHGWATVPVEPDGPSPRPGSGHPTPSAGPAPPRELVVIHVTEAQLAELPLADHPHWADLLTDARRQASFWRRRPATTGVASTIDDLGVGLGGHEDLTGLLAGLVPAPAGRARPGGDPTGDAGADPRARFPAAAQRRWVAERNQTCVFPACGADAVHCEIDHTRPHAAGGVTLSWNLGPACAHDNALKEQPGWWVEQPSPGHFRWHSKTGHRYAAGPTGPVPDHPPPRRFAHPSNVTPHEYAGGEGAWTNDPYPVHDPPPRQRRPVDELIDRLRGRPPGAAVVGPDPPPGAAPDDAPPF